MAISYCLNPKALPATNVSGQTKGWTQTNVIVNSHFTLHCICKQVFIILWILILPILISKLGQAVF